jgi:hypothetical protein
VAEIKPDPVNKNKYETKINKPISTETVAAIKENTKIEIGDIPAESFKYEIIMEGTTAEARLLM